ncbi:MAG: hypothetical protein ACP5NF_09550 [Thermoanaerobaculum sp.]
MHRANPVRLRVLPGGKTASVAGKGLAAMGFGALGAAVWGPEELRLSLRVALRLLRLLLSL